jgi:hypothetical protein
MIMRRIATGHAADRRSIVIGDGALPHARLPAGRAVAL